MLRGYLHDRISASHYGVALTGSARRQSFRHPPMRATYMLDDPHSREEILASVDRGILVESFTNGQVEIGGGDFTFYVKTGWLIERGRITVPVKDINIIGSGSPKALEDVRMVAGDMSMDTGAWTCGKNGQGVPVSMGRIPSVLIGCLTVGGVSG